METERLRLLPWDARCDSELVRLSSMPEVMRYIGPGVLWPRDRALEVATVQREHWKRHGFGWRRAMLREDPVTFVGFIGLNYVTPGPEGLSGEDVEIGWWIDPAHWGNGYAREGALAVRDAFEQPVIARIHVENVRSIRIAEQLGLRRASQFTGPGGVPIVVYR